MGSRSSKGSRSSRSTKGSRSSIRSKVQYVERINTFKGSRSSKFESRGYFRVLDGFLTKKSPLKLVFIAILKGCWDC
jgi:hypothetical protein